MRERGLWEGEMNMGYLTKVKIEVLKEACGLDSVFVGSSGSVKMSLGEMGKKRKKARSKKGGMRGFYGSQKVGLQHTEKDIFYGVMMSFQLMVAGIQGFLRLLVDHEES